jgi:prepilin peptidase CpaA
MHFNSSEIIWALTIAFTLYAGWLDNATRRIPNWLTVPGVLAGVAVHSIFGGWHGFFMSIEGVGLGLAILLPLVVLRALGAGDWKLMGAIGAMVGPAMLLAVLFASVLVAGVMAVVLMIRERRVIATLHNIAILVSGFFTFGLRPNLEVSLDSPSALKLPFGVAAAIGTVLCFIATRWQA